VDFEDEAMPLLHLGPIQLELCYGSPAGVVIPPVGEKDPADIHKNAGNWSFLPHLACAIEAEDV
jgi:hypothetical protein